MALWRVQTAAGEREQDVDYLRPQPPDHVLTGHDARGRIDSPVANLKHAE